MSQFSVVLVCEATEHELLDLAGHCRSLKIPILYVRSYGLFGYCRLDVQEHCIVESHPETVIDLRLDQPWKELIDYAQSFDFTSTDSHYLTHVPFPVLLLEAKRRWTRSFPPTREQRSGFQQIVKSLTGNNIDDENVREAITHCHKFFTGTNISHDIQKVMNDVQVDHLNATVFFVY